MNSVHLHENVPPALREVPQWVVWKFVARDGKSTKVPVSAEHGWNASSTDPKTWATYERAIEAAVASRTYEGVGFVFSDADPFCGIDLDGCIVDGVLTEDARQVVEAFGSYTEVSPSGKGVKIFIRGRKPVGAGCVRP